MKPEDKRLIEQFEQETGKKAIWRGKETKSFLKWKKTKKKKKKTEIKTKIPYQKYKIIISLKKK